MNVANYFNGAVFGFAVLVIAGSRRRAMLQHWGLLTSAAMIVVGMLAVFVGLHFSLADEFVQLGFYVLAAVWSGSSVQALSKAVLGRWGRREL